MVIVSNLEDSYLRVIHWTFYYEIAQRIEMTKFLIGVRGLPLITYAPRGGGGGVKSPIHFHCVLHAKRGGGGLDSM